MRSAGVMRRIVAANGVGTRGCRSCLKGVAVKPISQRGARSRMAWIQPGAAAWWASSSVRMLGKCDAGR